MTNTFDISENSFSLLQQIFTKHSEIKEVLIFGSRAKGSHKNGSDVDPAIKGTKCSPALAKRSKRLYQRRIAGPLLC